LIPINNGIAECATKNCQGDETMIGITLTSGQIRAAPADVRRWIEREVMASLGLPRELAASASEPDDTIASETEAEEARPGHIVD
jgi:hypothetical protein